MMSFKKEKQDEEIIASFFQPYEGDKIALTIAVVLLLVFCIIAIIYSLTATPNPSSIPFFILALLFLPLLALLAFVVMGRLTIGINIHLTRKGIIYKKQFIPYETIQGIFHWAPTSDLFYIPRQLHKGFFLLTTPPQDLRAILKKEKLKFAELLPLIKKNCLFIPPDVINLPKLLKTLSSLVPSAGLDIESLLIAELAEGGSLLTDPYDIFQAKLYAEKSHLSSHHNFYEGLKDLLRLNFKGALKKLKKAYQEGETRARPYLALIYFLQQQYNECVSLLANPSVKLNRGERLILLASLARQNKWEEVNKMIDEDKESYEEFFRLGCLCAEGGWDELLELGEKMKSKNIYLSLCLNCARELLAKRPWMDLKPSPPQPFQPSWRHQALWFLSILLASALYFLKSWGKWIGILLYLLLMYAIELLPRKYLEKEVMERLLYFFLAKFASPFWCSYVYLWSALTKYKDSERKGKDSL
ncbi:MAG: hypothetical protein ACPLPS_06940 [bacterium]